MNDQLDELANRLAWPGRRRTALRRCGCVVSLTGTILCLAAGFGWTTPALAQVQQAWVARYDGPAHLNDEPFALALDEAGSVYVSGSSIAANGASDYATVKYDTNGNRVWVARYNGPGNDWDSSGGIAVDSLGNVYVAGSSWSVSTDYDFATIKYDRDGRQLWVRRYNGPVNRLDSTGVLALDSAGNVYVTGNSEDTNGILDSVTVKYDTNGNQLWAARYNSGNWNVASSIVVDTAGNVYVNNSSRYSIHFDYNTLKYNSDGVLLWEARYDGQANLEDQAGAIAVDDSGNVYVTGWSQGIGTGFDCVTLKYDSDGNRVWVARYDGPTSTNDFGNDIAVDGSGNVYVTGSSDSDDAHQGGFLPLKYGPNGNQLWVARYDGSGHDYDYARKLALDKFGNVYVAGESSDSDGHYHFETVKYDASGNQVWEARYDGPKHYDSASRLAVNDAGNVFVTGWSYSDSGADFDFVTIKYVQTPAAPRLDAPMLLLGGEFQFTVLGEAGKTCEVQVSSDLFSWTSLTNFISATGTNQFTDATAPNFSRRFYRAVTH